MTGTFTQSLLQDSASAQSQAIQAGRRSGSSRSGGKTDGQNRFAHYIGRPLRRVPPILFAFALFAALYAGHRANVEGHLTPEKGAGYWLGIVGGLAMLTLLLYPMRKKFSHVRWLGRTTFWFRAHMTLGLIGPALILIHCDFKPGSLNSAVALFSMLLVAGSGLVGRYFYSRVHMGLYGRKARLQELLEDRDALDRVLGAELPDRLDVMAQLRAHAERSMKSSVFSRLFLQRGRSRRLQRILLADIGAALRADPDSQSWGWRARRRRNSDLRKALKLYFAATDKAATFGIYDRMLSAWHVAHLPLFFLLILAAIVHVVAVHLY